MGVVGAERHTEEPRGSHSQTVPASPSKILLVHSTPSPASPASPSVLLLDRKNVQALFTALRTSIPAEVQQSLLRDSLEELKFLIARQPRLSSFRHRRRESLRHPALAMATKNYYQVCRRKRIELAVQAVAVEQFNVTQYGRADAQEHQTDGSEAKATQRESEMVDMLLAEYAQSGGFQEDPGWVNHHYGAGNALWESTSFGESMSFGSRGLSAASGQLMGSIGVAGRDMLSEASFSMGESRTGAPSFFTDFSNSSLECTVAVCCVRRSPSCSTAASSPIMAASSPPGVAVGARLGGGTAAVERVSVSVTHVATWHNAATPTPTSAVLVASSTSGTTGRVVGSAVGVAVDVAAGAVPVARSGRRRRTLW